MRDILGLCVRVDGYVTHADGRASALGSVTLFLIESTELSGGGGGGMSLETVGTGWSVIVCTSELQACCQVHGCLVARRSSFELKLLLLLLLLVLFSLLFLPMLLSSKGKCAKSETRPPRRQGGHVVSHLKHPAVWTLLTLLTTTAGRQGCTGQREGHKLACGSSEATWNGH